MTVENVWENVPLRPDTKLALTAFKEVAGMTYDDAVAYLLENVLLPEDGGSLERAALRVRMSRTKPVNVKKEEGRANMVSTSLVAGD